MRLAILSRKRSLHATRRLKEEAVRRRHRVKILDPLQCVPAFSEGRPSVLVRGRELDPLDAVIPRVGTTGVAYALSIVRQFGLMGQLGRLTRELSAVGSRQRLPASLDLVRDGNHAARLFLSRKGAHCPVKSSHSPAAGVIAALGVGALRDTGAERRARH